MEEQENPGILAVEFAALVSIFVSITFIAPVIHEAIHIIFLKLIGCAYNFSWSYSLLPGFRGAVQPLCNFQNSQNIFFYASGYLGTLFLGLAPLIVSIEEKLYSSKTIFLVDTVAAGLLFSMITSLGAGKDIFLLVEIAGLPSVTGHLLNFTIAATGLLLGYRIFSKERWKQHG